MKKEEALKQIESISEILNSGDQILLSVPHLCTFGVFLCLIPIVDLLTNSFTFGADMSSTTTVIINVLAYYFIFFALNRILHKFFNKTKQSSHNQIISKAFKIKYAFIAVMTLGSAALGFSGNGILIYPVIYITIGLLYNLIGQFSLKEVKYVSWSYILGGILFIYLTSVVDYNYLWKCFVIYMGISYLFMAWRIHEYRKSNN